MTRWGYYALVATIALGAGIVLGYRSAVTQARQCSTVNPEYFACPSWVRHPVDPYGARVGHVTMDSLH